MNEMTRRELLAKGAAATAGVALGLGTIRVRPAQAASKAFTYDASTIFPNPERGWFYSIDPDYQNNATMPHEDSQGAAPGYELNEQTLAQKRSEGMSIVRKYYMLYEWRSSDIPQSFFDEHLLYDFDLCRRSGFKLVPRFAYVWNIQNYDDTDATKDWILRHIDQIAPHLNSNIDVLAHLEAGFVGYFGEWHTSKAGNLASDQTLNQNSRDIYAAIVAAAPQERMVLMRQIKHIRELYTDPLPDSEAYSSSNQARTGMHDDSFLYSVTHRGTYSSDATERDQERAYQAQMTKWTPMSGEPSGNDGTGYVFQNPIPECERMHWRMMNSNWYEAQRDGVYDSWKQNGYYDEMNRRFGYRFALNGSVTYSGRVRPNGTFNMSFAVGNYGFGAPYNVRLADLVVQHATTGQEYYRSMYYQIAVPARWQPGSSYTVNVTGRLPSGAPTGTYKVFLSFPDSWSPLYSDGRYSIQLANNETTWESAKGYNALNISFIVGGLPVKPDSSVPEFQPR